MSKKIINEIITDKSSDSESEEESWYHGEISDFDKIGMIIIQNENIINIENLRKIIHLFLSVNSYDNYKFKIINKCIKKNKDISNKILNYFIYKILDYDLEIKSIVKKNQDKYFEIRKLELNSLIQSYEKVIEEYSEVISEDSVILYFDILSKI